MKQLAAILSIIGALISVPALGQGLPSPIQDTDYRTASSQMVRLGQLLFYDRVLSGTYRVSCATCHNPDRAGSNGFRTDAKPEDEGDDLAINGLPLYEALKPSAKHAPALFNLGAREFTALFSDGRVAARKDGTFLSPAGAELPPGLTDVLAVQALFPAVTGDELVGTVDNEVKEVAHLGNRAVWHALATRVHSLPEYWAPFQAAYPQIEALDAVDISHIANAISAFVGDEWRSDSAPFDAYLNGEKTALSAQQINGLNLFYGKAGCSQCHAGKFQTDHGFHAVATPLWRFDVDLEGGEFDLHKDRAELTGKDADKFRRRTPSLRNVEWTPPYGHAGSFETLEAMLRAHLDPVAGLRKFVADRLGDDPIPSTIANQINALAERNELRSVSLSNTELDDLIAFLVSLSQPTVLAGKRGRPDEVPSSLALD
ncbi:MAG: cytochrome c peroxidase [Rhizobiaceae bacterium]